jgi:hypothetical protein
MKLWTKLLVWLGIRCPCGGILEDVNGWNKSVCLKCKKTYRW